MCVFEEMVWYYDLIFVVVKLKYERCYGGYVVYGVICGFYVFVDCYFVV